MFTKLIVVIISQHVQILNLVVHLKLIQCYMSVIYQFFKKECIGS